MFESEGILIPEWDVIKLNSTDGKAAGNLDINSASQSQRELHIGVEAVELSLYSSHQGVPESFDSVATRRQSRTKEKVEGVKTQVTTWNVEGLPVIAEIRNHPKTVREIGGSTEANSVYSLALLDESSSTRVERVVDVHIVAEVRVSDEYFALGIVALRASRDDHKQCHSNKQENSLHTKFSLLNPR